MKIFVCVSLLSIVGSCATLSYKEKIQNIKDGIVVNQPDKIKQYSSTITSTELKEHLYKFASKEFEGRQVGSKGQKLAANYIKDYYISENITSPIKNDEYFQDIPKETLGLDYNDSENVVAYIEGTEKPNEVLIISAHLDHEGIDDDGNIYYGADDDGSGTVALLEMAQAFKLAKKDGHGPKRSILFLHLTAEETGLQGSRYYVNNPIFPLDKTVSNLNIDMIGRVDRRHEENPNYIYLIGADRLSKELHYISEKINNTFFNIDLDYKYNDEEDQNRYYYRSDHYNFASHNIPVIFYFNGEHDDYHKPSDTPDKINYPLLEKRTRLIFATAWQLANQENRIKLDN
ncbi:MAG: M28 family metallopeptidase [Flavobacteriaceae bacterium]|nr:M28 family peptidase [Flavobacteriaceae bacterium]